MKNQSSRLADTSKTRKKLHKCFEQFGLKITVEANLHVVNFLDVTFDINNGKVRPLFCADFPCVLLVNYASMVEYLSICILDAS